MAINFPTMVYLPAMEVFARPVTVIPYASQPGAAPYGARGIFDTNDIEVEGLDGSLVSDTRTELDILQSEFSVLPMQDDRISIPDDEMLPGGEFLVANVTDKGNAGGEVTLVLRRIVTWKLIGYQFDVGRPDFARPILISGGLNWAVGSPTIAIPPLTVSA